MASILEEWCGQGGMYRVCAECFCQLGGVREVAMETVINEKWGQWLKKREWVQIPSTCFF